MHCPARTHTRTLTALPARLATSPSTPVHTLTVHTLTALTLTAHTLDRFPVLVLVMLVLACSAATLEVRRLRRPAHPPTHPPARHGHTRAKYAAR